MATAEVSALEKDVHRMDLYSRQIGAYGVEAMAKLVKLKVLVVGLRGVGIEVAKNLTLAGPGGVTLCDNETVKERDLGTNFFLTHNDVGKKSRAEACQRPLQELNRLVEVHCVKQVDEKVLKQHSCLVVCGGGDPEQTKKWNEQCRKLKIGFILVGVTGLCGHAFVDLGEEFTVRDRNGEQPVTRIIDKIEAVEGSPGEIIVRLIPAPDGKRHNIDDNDHEGHVDFDEVEGELGKELNGKGPFRCHHMYNERTDSKTGKAKKVFDAYALRVVVDKKGKRKLPAYSGGGGSLAQVKQPEIIKFRSLESCCENPVATGEFSLLFTDGAKFGRAEQLHVALMGLWEFQRQHGGAMPRANNEKDTEEVIKLALQVNESQKGKPEGQALHLEEVDDKVVHMLAKHAACEFQPLSTFFGGVVAQEVVKLTGKFTPLRQWLHVDCFEVLPDEFVGADAPFSKVKPEDRKASGGRYDDLVEILGRPLQESLTGKKTFMVGCGALGCELLKNFALLGVATTGDGLITVTDNDTIEVSNLSRQFLFREHNVGQPKSAAAAAAVTSMNPELKVRALQQFVGAQTENVFNDKFWESQDFVTNALDNVTARLYVDGQCVFYEKPLLESGTLGTKCNVQVILPHVTSSYADGPKDDGGDAIPMCTLRNFPSQIEHCIEWARARFTDLFATAATQAQQFAANPDKWLKELRAKTVDLKANRGKVISAVENELAPTKEMLVLLERARSPENCFAECVREAFGLFHRLFRDNIDSLVSTYPEDARDKSGNLFWSGTKRFPQSAKFDVGNAAHMDFIISTANLIAVNVGLQPGDQPLPANHPWRQTQHVGAILAKLEVPKPVKEKVDMTGGGEEEEAGKKNDDANEGSEKAVQELELVLQELELIKKDAKHLLVEPAEFEKDADWNFHIDFITAASNLRAWNYRLKQASRHQSKMIAGKIIPALATTTAAVTGLVMIEMIKAMQPGKKADAFKDSSNSLGINGYFFSQPSEPEKAKDEYDPIEMSEVKCKPPGFSKWDKTDVRKGRLTLEGFLDAFYAATGLHCVTLYHESAGREGSKGHSQFLYEKNAWKKDLKELYEKRLTSNLEDLVHQLYGEDALPPGRTYVALAVSPEDEDGNPCKVPAAVYHFA